MKVKIFHNPRCSKSRATLQLLQDQGIEPEVIDYRNNPPSIAELEKIIDMLGIEPRQLVRQSEDVYKQQQLDNPQTSRQQLLQAMADHPILIQRPIVLANGKAAIGRPPEAVLDII